MSFPDLPILIGVTGHRDILPHARPAVEQGVRAALTQLRDCVGPSLIVMTALAEGADQLVADVASELGIGMVAISPMPLARYRGTMAICDGFDRLWVDPLILERLELPMTYPHAPEMQSDEAQYEQLGLLLSRQSHILLALWNGHDLPSAASRTSQVRSGRGGTPHVVAMRRWGERGEVTQDAIASCTMLSGPPPRLELARSGPILHVVTPRERGGGSVCLDAQGNPYDAGSLLWWSDLPGHGPRHLWRSLRDMLWPGIPDKAQEDVVRHGWRPIRAARLPSELPVAFQSIKVAAQHMAKRAKAHASGSYLCADAAMTPPRDTPALRRLRDAFDLADADASDYQRRLFGTWLPGLPWPKRLYLGVLFWFALAVPASTLCFELFVAYDRTPWFMGLYLAAVLIPLGLYLGVVGRHQWQARYQDHRALAEGLRVQFYWAASGLPVAVSDNYLRYQTGTLGWIRLALRGPALNGLIAALSISAVDPAFVTPCWIDDQMAYFRRQSRLQEAAGIWAERLTRLVLFGLLALAVVVLFLKVSGYGHNLAEAAPEGLAEWPIVALGTLPALAAFFVIIAEGRAFDEHAHAYIQSHDVFAEAKHQASTLDPVHDAAGWRELLLALGQEALAENAAWIHTHRARPVANRVGG